MPTPTLHTDDPVLQDFVELVGQDDPVTVAGGRTRWELGGVVDPGARMVDAPQGVVDYKPEEMTVTVRAGTTVAELHDVLAEQGQRTALPERGGTVGGALVVGESDHRALGRGLVRTALLQVRYVSAEARLISSGGPTVKNVSGFDLPRLMVGSLGTLGLVAEVILRTNPIPAVTQWLTAETREPGPLYQALLHPSAVLWDGERVWIQLEGHAPDVAAQRDAAAALVELNETDAPPEFSGHRWSLPPGDLLGLGSGPHDTGEFLAAIGLGLVSAARPQPPRSLAPATATIAQRLKENFDPSGRLNPGRTLGVT